MRLRLLSRHHIKFCFPMKVVEESMPSNIHQQPDTLFQKCLLHPKDNKDTYAKEWEAYKRLRASAMVTQEVDNTSFATGTILKGGNELVTRRVTLTDEDKDRMTPRRNN